VLNLVNGVVALVLNVGLNWVLIPEYGAMGAALATGSTLALWSLWRVVEVRWLLKCFPFGARGMLLLGIATLGGVGVQALTDGHALLPRMGATALLLVFLVAAGTLGRSPDDDAVLARIRTRLMRLIGRA
jgi:O-antigen/teichoic acid export membrane protein